MALANRVLVDTLQSLTRNLSDLPQTSAPFYGRVIRDLAAAAAAGLPRDRQLSDVSRRAKIIAYLKAQPSGEVIVDKMLDVLALTRPTLYRLFKKDGGVIAYVGPQPLRGLHCDLADPLDRPSIAGPGQVHGFIDPAHLARSFCATFGYPMSTLRKRVAALAPPGSEMSTADKLRIAVQGMSVQYTGGHTWLKCMIMRPVVDIFAPRVTTLGPGLV